MPRPVEIRPARQRIGAAALALAAAIAVPAAAQQRPLIATIDHFFVVSDDSERLFNLFAETFGLPELTPANAWVFFCDYKQRQRVNAGRTSRR